MTLVVVFLFGRLCLSVSVCVFSLYSFFIAQYRLLKFKKNREKNIIGYNISIELL